MTKEINILEDVINKANKRQQTENIRFLVQISEVRKLLEEKNVSRLECVAGVRRVEGNLGIEFDANESFTQPLHEKLSDQFVNKTDNMIINQFGAGAAAVAAIQELWIKNCFKIMEKYKISRDLEIFDRYLGRLEISDASRI